MATKVAINGFGRIGRLVMRSAFSTGAAEQIEFAAVNDLTDAKTLAHLFKYDSTFGTFKGQVEAKDNSIIINGREIKVLAQKDPSKLPWRDLGIDIVIESTGRFTGISDCKLHLEAGAKKVVLTARYKGSAEEAAMVNIGVNEKDYISEKHNIISNASCTTNSLTPVMKVLEDTFGVEKALMTTIHSYTSDQRILDFPHKDLRRARSAGLSIIPTTTNAAIAVTQVIPELNGKFDGMAMRIPTACGAISDMTVITKRNVTVEEVNSALKKASEGNMKGILGYSEEPLVSRDYIGNTCSATVDALSTRVMGGNLVKVLSWYDNEWGYSCRIVDLTVYVAKSLK